LPLFALVAAGLLVWLRMLNRPSLLFRQYLTALILAVALGAGGEILQAFAERDAEWVDLLNDLLGAMAGLSIYALYDRRRLLSQTMECALWMVVVAAVVVVVFPIGQTGFMYWQRWQQLPQLVSWNSSAGYHFVTANSAQLHVEGLPRWSGKVDEIAMRVSPIEKGRWVGISIDEPWPDWSLYSHLAIEVVNPNDSLLSLWLRVDDRMHNNTYDDRFTRRFDIAALTRTTLTVPLVEVRTALKLRQFDLKQVAVIILFQDAELGALPLYVCGVRLIR